MSRRSLAFTVVVVLAAGCRPPSSPAPDVAETPAVLPVAAPEPLIAADGSDPVALFKPILARLRDEPTPVRVFSLGTGKWHKSQMAVATMTHMVRKTDSVAAPFEAIVSYGVVSYLGPECLTKQTSEVSHLPNEPLPVDRPKTYFAIFLFRDGAWAVADCGWDDQLHGLHISHSDNRDGDASVGEWWAYFGGGAP